MAKPFWILMKEETMEWQWHQLDHIAAFRVCGSGFLTDRTPFIAKPTA